MFELEPEDDALNLEEEFEILAEAYRNAYLIITGKLDVQDLIERQTLNGGVLFIPFDPSAPETIDLIIDDLIAFFEENEEYEKCKELLDIKNKEDDTQ